MFTIAMSSMLKLLFITTLVNISLVLSQNVSESTSFDHSDLVKWLPNYTGDYSKIGHYSGYLKADERSYLYYWFFRSQSENWITDPVVLWLNGGPGGSSLLGALSSFGPLNLDEHGTLTRNPSNFDRSQKANLLFIETPVRVGFSYQHSPADKLTFDSQTAKHNLGAIKNFYEKFPQLVDNDLYLSGVSYASIYNLPLGVGLVKSEFQKNIKGVFISSGVFDYDNSILHQIQYAHTVGLIDQYDWTQLTQTCCPKAFCSFRECTIHSVLDYQYCRTLRNLIQEDLMKSLDLYNIHKKARQDDATKTAKKNLLQNWLRNETVMNELHINNYSKAWDSVWGYFNEKPTHLSDILDVSHHVCQLLESGIRILILNGDADLSSSYIEAKWLLGKVRDELPIEHKSTGPWVYKGKLAGQKQEYLFNQTELTFMVLHGAGHRLDAERLEQVFQLFTDFISHV